MNGLSARLACIVVVWVVGTTSAAAHDIPNARIERSTQIILAAERLQVDYEVVLAELTLSQDLRQIDGESFAGTRAELFERYARVVGPLNARGFLVRVDDQEVELQPVDFAIVVEDHPRFRFRFEAKIPLRGHLSVFDTNYTSSEGSSKLALRVAPGLRVIGDRPPAEVESIPFRPTWQLTDTEEKRTKRLVVDFEPGPHPATPSLSPVEPPPSATEPSRRGSSGLTRLLDQPSGVTSIGWMLTAFLLGMVHAIQPGHGKTLVAAASLDGPGAARRGVWLGLITAGCHLVGVVAVAGVLWSFSTNRVGSIHLVLARASGFLIAAVGAFRVGRHLAGINPTHTHLVGPSAGLWSLGLAAGFVPCWDAVALVVVANTIGQLRWGLILLAAFSLGLAVILVGVGWFAGRLRSRFQSASATPRTHRWLGLASGLILATIGLGLLNS